MRWENDDAWRPKLPWYSLCDRYEDMVDIRVIQKVEEEIRLIYEGDEPIAFVICYSNNNQIEDCINPNPQVDMIQGQFPFQAELIRPWKKLFTDGTETDGILLVKNLFQMKRKKI